MLLEKIDALTEKIDRLTARIETFIGELAEAQPSAPSGPADARGGPGASALTRLDEIPGMGLLAAQVIVAEIGLDMTQFPTAGHLVS